MRRLLTLLVLLAVAVPSTASVQDAANDSARLLHEAYEKTNEITKSWDNEWYLFGSPELAEPELARRAYETMQPVIGLIQRAMREGRPEFSGGQDNPFAIAPQLVEFRILTRMLAADVDYRVMVGETEHVGDNLAQLVEFGSFPRDDRSLYGSLIDVAVAAAARSTIDRAIGRGGLDPSAARTILDAMDGTIQNDLHGLRGAVETERSRHVEWMREMNNTDESREQMIDVLAQQFDPASQFDELNNLRTMSATDIDSATVGYDTAMERYSDILEMDDLDLAQIEAERLEADVASGLYGPFATFLGPSIASGTIRNLKMSLELSDSLREKLTELATDPDAAAKLRNAALIYEEAFATFRRLPREVRAHFDRTPPMRVIGSGRAQALRESEDGKRTHTIPLADALVGALPVVALLYEASKIERCDFDPGGTRDLGGLWPWLGHVDEMRTCAEILFERIESAAFAESGQSDVRTLLAMSQHIAQDGTFDAAALSREIAVRLDDAIAGIDLAQDDEQLDLIVDRFIEDDPFGFRHAIHKHRTRARKWMPRDFNSPQTRQMMSASGSAMTTRTDSVFPEDEPILAAEIAALSGDDLNAGFSHLRHFVETWADHFAQVFGDENISVAEVDLEVALMDTETLGLERWHRVAARPLPLAAREAFLSQHVWKTLRDKLTHRDRP